MPIPDFTSELQFSFSRSGGAGGQNVNKVSTAATASWELSASQFFTEDEKQLLAQKLASRINKEGLLQLRSQEHRTQLANREEVTKRFLLLVENALHKRKPRIATKPSKAAKQKRLDSKKLRAGIKANRSSKWED